MLDLLNLPCALKELCSLVEKHSVSKREILVSVSLRPGFLFFSPLCSSSRIALALPSLEENVTRF